MPASQVIQDLITRFENNLDAYKSPKYNEAQLRGEFINPMFEAMGWDVYNKKGYAEAYKDVIHEDAIKVGGATKAPDYSFRIGGVRKFFLETKKPSVNIKEDPEPAFQLRRYAWSAKLPLSILTDFEEFAVYDTRIKPAPNDKPSTGRIMYFNYNEYPEKWDDIASIFSREAILKGSFDRFVESEKKKRGTAEVDDAFLKEIESWRDAIARNIALRNEGLTERDINYAVQLTIDRIIFLRICEDRGIEEYGRLQALINGERIYKRMFDLFYRADEKYNSGLFHFQIEKGRPADPDELTPDLKIDDKVLKDIIKGLYYPESPYEFSVLPVDILGHVYERFLGKVIRLTAGGRAKVEEKPEVRKAGGVYYTPKYIVEYIVENTVGKLLDKKKPKQVEKIRILDPACGSGSFLIGAYEYLLDWHRDWYVENDPSKHTKQIYQGAGDQWYLTTAEKKRILLNNIYGVDIDPQAVEVTKLNLLLKALEGESEETIESQLKMFRERALPDLRGNIKCGNSLIGPDFYDDTQLDLLDDEERYRINAFDWEREFGEVMKGGGFDVVIGNPPWRDIKGMEPELVDYYFAKYSTTHNRMNIYATFLHKSIDLVKKNGYLGFITPSSYYAQSSYEYLREYLLNISMPVNIVRLPDNTFKGVKLECAITIFEKSKNKDENCSIKIYDPVSTINNINGNNLKTEKVITPNNWLKNSGSVFNIYMSDKEQNIIDKIEVNNIPLIKLCDFSLGLTPYDKYRGHTEEQIKSKVFHADKKKNKTFKPLLSGSDITRFSINWNGKKWISYGDWLGAPREKRFFIEPRILVRQIISGDPLRIYAGYTEEELYNTQIAFNILLKEDIGLPIRYILGIINSSLMTFYHRYKFLDESKKTFQKILIQDAKKFPIIRPNDDVLQNHIVSNVENIIIMKERLLTVRSDHDKTTIQRQIDATDRQIDELVYELYGLTEEERRVVEGEDR